MNELKKINLPFGETLKRSFLYVTFNADAFLKVASIGMVVLIYEAFSGFPMMCSLNPQSCLQNSWQMISNLLTFFVSVAAIINYCRVVVLKSNPDYMSIGFLRRLSKYILVTLGLGLSIIFIAVSVFLIFRLISFIDESTVYMLSALLGVILSICASPLFVYLGAIAVDDSDLTIKQTFVLCKGNFNKIFWGQTLLMFPGVILMFAISAIYQIYPTDSYFGKLMYVFCLVVASLFDTCVKGAFFAHIYQYFIFYKNKQ